MKRQYRQGDVLIEETDGIPDGGNVVSPDNGRIILAYGEVTGHAHALPARAGNLIEVSGDRFLNIDGPKTPNVDRPVRSLRHEEHFPIPLYPVAHQVIGQRQYTPEAIIPAYDEPWSRGGIRSAGSRSGFF